MHRIFILTIILIVVGCGNGPQISSIEDGVRMNNIEYIKKWHSNGGNVDMVFPDGGCLLDIATGPKGGIESVKVLIELGANPNGHGDYTPLMNAVSWVDLSVVTYLLEHGADPTRKSKSGKSAVDVIGNNNSDEMGKVKSLLQDKKWLTNH